MRQNLGDEQIAAVILGGKLNEEKSRMNGTLPEIVVEAKFKDFPWLDLKDDGSEKFQDRCRVGVNRNSERSLFQTKLITRRRANSFSPCSTVREYFSILEDTLIGFTIEPWMASRKRKAARHGL